MSGQWPIILVFQGPIFMEDSSDSWELHSSASRADLRERPKTHQFDLQRRTAREHGRLAPHPGLLDVISSVFTLKMLPHRDQISATFPLGTLVLGALCTSEQ